MTESLKTMIRLHDWNVDGMRRKLGGLMQGMHDLEDQSRRLERELIDEQKQALAAPETGLYYGNYAMGAIQRRETIAASAAALDEQIVKAREKLHEAFRELKKYEVAHKNRQRRELEEENHKEQLSLDEQGLQTFRRQQSQKQQKR